MNVKNIFRFLFPEYQVIEEIKEYGFIAKKARQAVDACVLTMPLPQGRWITKIGAIHRMIILI